MRVAAERKAEVELGPLVGSGGGERHLFCFVFQVCHRPGDIEETYIMI